MLMRGMILCHTARDASSVGAGSSTTTGSREALASAPGAQRLAPLGVRLAAASPAELQALLGSEIRDWGGGIRAAQIEPEYVSPKADAWAESGQRDRMPPHSSASVPSRFQGPASPASGRSTLGGPSAP